MGPQVEEAWRTLPRRAKGRGLEPVGPWQVYFHGGLRFWASGEGQARGKYKDTAPSFCRGRQPHGAWIQSHSAGLFTHGHAVTRMRCSRS